MTTCPGCDDCADCSHDAFRRSRSTFVECLDAKLLSFGEPSPFRPVSENSIDGRFEEFSTLSKRLVQPPQLDLKQMHDTVLASLGLVWGCRIHEGSTDHDCGTDAIRER